MVDPNELTFLTVPELHGMYEFSVANVAGAKADLDQLKAEMARRYGDSAKQALDQAGKSHGSISLPLQDGFTAKTDTKQTVTWDSAALQSVAATLPWERVVALFSIKFTMSETIYKGVAALSPELREKIDAARTTKIAEPVVTLTKEAA